MRRARATARRAIRRALLACGRGARAGRGGRAPEPVYILLANAWSMGGTVRTVLNLAGHLAESREVEVLSVLRRRDQPFFEFPEGVTVTAIDDQRPKTWSPAVRAARSLLDRQSTLLVHRADRVARRLTLWSDLRLARALHRRTHGVLIGTRPALNL